MNTDLSITQGYRRRAAGCAGWGDYSAKGGHRGRLCAVSRRSVPFSPTHSHDTHPSNCGRRGWRLGRARGVSGPDHPMASFSRCCQSLLSSPSLLCPVAGGRLAAASLPQ